MYEYESPDVFRRIFPALRKIAFWMRASRTLDGAIPWLCYVDASGVMAATCLFQHFNMPKNPDNDEKLMVSVLGNISDGINLSY
jgi:hypothetical protein